MKTNLAALAITGLLLSVPAFAAAAGQPAVSAKTAPIDLNTATLADLESLPGVGRRTAELIIEYRQKNGGFKKVEELMNVKGIGEKSFLRLKPLVAAAPKAEKAGGAR
ncbi:MAG: helix-hairpin-helix domain-containing protein [Acidobacteriota bacterium]|nr:helix-hairpin-helix domain-containing protein [Acidobacteriota bacterium]